MYGFQTAEDIANHFRNPFMSREDAMRVIDAIQLVAEQHMFSACARLQIPLDDIDDDDDRCLTAFWSLKEAEGATVSDRHACSLLMPACRSNIPAAWTSTFDRILIAFAGLDADKTELGRKFVAGRKVGAVGPVRKAVQQALKRKPKATTPEVWAIIKRNPPRGLVVHNKRTAWARIDKAASYIAFGRDGRNGYRTFETIVSDERRLLASSSTAPAGDRQSGSTKR